MAFKEIYDALTKRKTLEQAYSDAADMLKRDKYMFNEACNALLAGETFRKGVDGKKIPITEVLSLEDKKINRMEIGIREFVFEYLALNTAPDISAALTLTSIVIDLERLGDYTKDLAKLMLNKPIKIKGDVYIESVKEWKTTLLEMFELTQDAFENEDKEKAHQVMELNKQLRRDTDAILKKLEKDNKLTGKEILTYGLYTRYFRRVAAHLENVATSVITPFKYTGFKGKTQTRHVK